MNIYLACPISGRTMQDVQSWKHVVMNNLADCVGIEWLDPAHGEDWKGHAPHRNYHGWEMFRTDKFLIQQSDIILINLLGFPKVSTGCCVEKGMADAWGKLVVLVIDDDNPHYTDMMTKGTIVTQSLQEAIDFLRKVSG